MCPPGTDTVGVGGRQKGEVSSCTTEGWPGTRRSYNLEWKTDDYIILNWISQFLNSDHCYNLKVTEVIDLPK